MKTRKSYRLSPAAEMNLIELKKWHPNMNETDIVEWAIASLWGKEWANIERENDDDGAGE